jgi:hypothetical protein
MLKTDGIPLWVTIFALLVVLTSGGLGLMALAGMDVGQDVGDSWGGRSLGLGLVAAMAVIMKSPILYVAAFAGGLARDAGDLIEELAKAESSAPVTAFIAAFIVAGALGLWSANKARKP